MSTICAPDVALRASAGGRAEPLFKVARGYGGPCAPRTPIMPSCRDEGSFQRSERGDATVDLRYIPDSGFMARGTSGPRRDNVTDWLVWHFTHLSNIPAICEAGKLLPSAAVQPRRSVANDDVKDRRTCAVAPDVTYPQSAVRDHVPFYVAAKSPMLFAVTSPGSGRYKAKSSELVFLGSVVGDVIEAGLTCCFSNGNAASSYTSFTRDLGQVGNFVDFDLMCQRMWRNTPEDPFRQGRRAAEFLVLDEVPLGLITVVVARNEAGLAEVRRHLKDSSIPRQYRATDAIFYN